jgi:hypothetical protein
MGSSLKTRRMHIGVWLGWFLALLLLGAYKGWGRK